jgi:hypothetical protein
MSKTTEITKQVQRLGRKAERLDKLEVKLHKLLTTLHFIIDTEDDKSKVRFAKRILEIID